MSVSIGSLSLLPKSTLEIGFSSSVISPGVGFESFDIILDFPVYISYLYVIDLFNLTSLSLILYETKSSTSLVFVVNFKALSPLLAIPAL